MQGIKEDVAEFGTTDDMIKGKTTFRRMIQSFKGFQGKKKRKRVNSWTEERRNNKVKERETTGNQGKKHNECVSLLHMVRDGPNREEKPAIYIRHEDVFLTRQ